MKIGVKIHPERLEYLKEIKEHIDFFELYAVEGKNYNFLAKNRMPFIIHSEDFKYQSNLANADNNDINKRYMRFLFDLLNKYKAEYMILNAGIKFNNRCSIDNYPRLFRGYPVKKIYIENQPPLKNKTYPFFARNYDEVNEVIKRAKVNFCFDLAHAYCSAFFFEKDPEVFIKDILELKPKHFHISNGKILSFIDQHLHFFDGDFDMKILRAFIPDDAMVTIDTENDLQKQIEEIKFLREKSPVIQ